MQVSEQFSKMIRSGIAILLMIVFAVALYQAIPSNRAHAQNAGNVGIYTKQISVFSAQTSSTSSAIFPDFGFGANYLTYTTTTFTGTIDLEWSPTGSAPFLVLAKATWSGDTTGSNAQHVLQVGGYFPNMRSTITVASGTVSAWYSAQANAISFQPPAIGSNGPTSPIQCDQAAPAAVVTSGSSSALVGTSRGMAVCAFTISFLGATSAAVNGVELGFGSNCAGGVYPWFIATTASTPQIINIGSGLGAIFQAAFNVSQLCVTNNSGASLEISVSYALL